MKALLEREYGARVTSLVPIAEYGNDEGGVYRIVRQGGPPWVLRLFARNRPLDRVRGDAAILDYVSRSGVPAELPVATPDGRRATDLDGQGVVVTHFVVGSRPDRSPATLRRLGEALGHLHALTIPPGDPWLGRRAGSLPAEDLRGAHADLARVAGRIQRERRAEFEALRTALDQTTDCKNLPTTLTHSDCHLDNAILTPDGQTVMIDWVGSGQGPRVAALGVLLYSSAVLAPGDAPDSPWATYWQEHGSPAQSDGVLDTIGMKAVVEAVIAGYCQHLLLTPAEVVHLPDAVRFRPLAIAAREFAASIERGTSADPSGWWARYAEADLVAAYARESIEVFASGEQSLCSGVQKTCHSERQ